MKIRIDQDIDFLTVSTKKPYCGQLFSEIDLLLVEEGVALGAGSEEIAKAKEILEKKTKFTLIKKSAAGLHPNRAQKGQKRGPKPTPSTNSTDCDEAVCLEAIRIFLGPDAEALTKPQLLIVIVGLCKLLQNRRRSGVFLSSVQRQSLHLISEKGETLAVELSRRHSDGDLSLGSSFTISPTIVNITKLLRGLEKCVWDNAARKSWGEIVGDAIRSVPARGSKTSSEARFYRELRRALDLELDAAEALAIYGTFGPTEGAQPNMRSDKRQFVARYRQFHPKVAVPDVLKMAQECLLLLRYLADQYWYCAINVFVERLFLLVRAWSNHNHPDALPPAVAAIDTIFLSAARGQKMSPFPPTSNDELSLGPPDNSIS